MAEKEKKQGAPRAKRATMGFQILEVVKTEQTLFRAYQQICEEHFKSLTEAERHIRKNVEVFKDKVLVIAHLKKELKVSTETKPVAKLEEIN